MINETSWVNFWGHHCWDFAQPSEKWQNRAYNWSNEMIEGSSWENFWDYHCWHSAEILLIRPKNWKIEPHKLYKINSTLTLIGFITIRITALARGLEVWTCSALFNKSRWIWSKLVKISNKKFCKKFLGLGCCHKTASEIDFK